MTNHEKRGNPGITHGEASATCAAFGDLDPAHFEYRPDGYEARVRSALSKLDALPHGSVLVPFSRKELGLLRHALDNGAGDDAINHLGLRSDEKKALSRAYNRIADAGKLGGPRFDAS